MFDTVSLSFPAVPLHHDLVSDYTVHGRTDLESWTYSPSKAYHTPDGIVREGRLKRKLGHDCTFTVFIKDEECIGCIVSLPKLLYRKNCRLIIGQDEVDRAEQLIRTYLNEICDLPTDHPFEFNRIDLVTQLEVPDIPPAAFFSSMRNATHPRVRSCPETYTVEHPESGLRFKGSDYVISLYDKRFECYGSPGEVIRIEIQVRNSRVGTLFGDHSMDRPSRLDFDEAYRVFRSEMLQFPSIDHLSAPVGRGVKPLIMTVLADLENQGATLSDGSRPMEYLNRANVCRQTKSKFRKDFACQQLHAAHISFEDLLPPQWPPEYLAADIPDPLACFS